MNQPIVVLDACVLIPMPLCDTLLRAAERGLYRFYTSPKILGETTRNLAKILIKQNKIEPDEARKKSEKRINSIRKAFPEALVFPSESLIESLDNDPKDRHVLAAAIEAQKLEVNTSLIIVTHNLKDFPGSILSKYNVKAIAPDQFLLLLIEFYDTTEDLFNLLQKQADDHNNQLFDLLIRLENGGVKQFVKVIITDYLLEEIYQKLLLIVKKIGKKMEEKKYLKMGQYEMYLDGKNIRINSLSKSCSIEIDGAEVLKNDIDMKDVQNLERFIRESKKIIQSGSKKST